MNELINFDGPDGSLETVEIPVKIDGKDYVLREADGAAATSYRNQLLASMKLGPDGKPSSIHGLASVEPMLVSRCLFDEKNKSVPLKVVEGWPSRVQKTLFAKAKEISMLQEEATDRDLLGKALAVEGSPLAMDGLRSFVDGLGKDYDSLKQWLKPTPEERIKNSSTDTTDG